MLVFKKKTRIEVFSDGLTNNPAIYNVILSIPVFLLPVRAQVDGAKKPLLVPVFTKPLLVGYRG